jgi:haloalkane dehalogenase
MQAVPTSPIPKDAREASAAFREPHAYVDAGGERLAYWRFGRGPDVVLIHGWPLHSATFRKIVPALAPKLTLHLFDLPGAGQSQASGSIDLATHSVTARRAIDRLGLGRYALLAHDSGGAVARLVAADDARVCGLVLAGTEIPGHHPWLVRFYAALTKVPIMTRLVLSSMRLGFVRRSFLGFGGCFADAAYVDGEFGDWFVRPLLASRGVAAGQMALLYTLDFGLLDALDKAHGRISAPVRCIWGTDDPFFPIAKARRMLGQFAGPAELVEIPGAKLFAHEDHPEAFAAHALPFLERCLRDAIAASQLAPEPVSPIRRDGRTLSG